MDKLHLDFETRSRADIKAIGGYNYSKHPSTSILCCGYGFNEEPIHVIRREPFLDGVVGTVPREIKDFFEYAKDPSVIFVAHNAMFERCVWHHILVPYYGAPAIPLSRWRCTLAKCAYYSLPKGLDAAASALSIGHKYVEGKKAMMSLSKPKTPSKKDPSEWESDPAKFEDLYVYNEGDVDLERRIDNAYPDIPQREQKIWFFDQRMNERGIPIDVDSVHLAHTRFNQLMDKGAAEFEELTGGIRVKQNVKLKEWLADKGYDTESVDAAHVAALVEQITEEMEEHGQDGDLEVAEACEEVLNVLSLKKELNATASIAKLSRMGQYADNELRRVYDAFQYCAGITHRWGGKNIQPQNLPRPGKDMDQFSEILDTGNIDAIERIAQIKNGLRAFIQAGEGKRFLIGDYAQIEARVNFWLAGEENGIRKFENGEDIYLDMAMVIYGKILTKENKDERQLGKASVLGCGYQMGWQKFVNAAKDMFGLVIEPELAKQTVKAYRQHYSKVVTFWYDQEEAAVAAMVEPGKVFNTPQNIQWQKVDIGPLGLPYLVCQLPSGSRMYYFKPKLTQEIKFGQPKMVLNYYKTDPQSGRMMPDHTYGGKLVENIVQSVARDIMAAGMLRVTKFNKAHGRKYNVIMTVHDELVAEVPDDNVHTEEEFLKLLVQREPWFADAPIDAEVKSAYRYTK